jgi:DhnA family fructose-bisphosphate aldolase class Ia
MMAEVVQSGARGATIGRNIWGAVQSTAGFEQVTQAVQAFKAVIHKQMVPTEAMRTVGISTKS